MLVMTMMVMTPEGVEPPEVISVAFPPSELLWCRWTFCLSVSWFSIFTTVHRRKRYLRIYIDGFRSKRIPWWWNRRHPRLEAPDHLYHIV
jgi:hypothetical protein